MKYQQILITILLIQIIKLQKTKSKKKTLQKTEYANTITIKSIKFEDTCFALSKEYFFFLEISQTNSNYPLIINNKFYLILESDSSISIPCSCKSNKGSSYLNCTLNEDLEKTNYNNKKFRLKKSNEIEFSCSKDNKKIEKCLIKNFDISNTITYHNLYDVVSKEQNKTYFFDFGIINEGILYVKFDTFVIGEGPLITLDGKEINNCEEIPYNDNEYEGNFIKCIISKKQFDVESFEEKNVVVINQCGSKEYPGIKVYIMKSKGIFSKFVNNLYWVFKMLF